MDEESLLFSAVHCTHGYNRTGFLIVAYLVEKLDWRYSSICAKNAPLGALRSQIERARSAVDFQVLRPSMDAGRRALLGDFE